MLRKAAFGPPVRNDYPTTDGKPMAETEHHIYALTTAVFTLKRWLADDPNRYAAGNMLMFYVPGDKRRHVSPDVYFVDGVPNRLRPNYLIWEEGRGPDLVIEITSASTRQTDLKKKFALYRDVIRVREYFLFDPLEEYLVPSIQGYRLVGGEYRPIRAKDGRVPSRVLGLHLDRDRHLVRFWNPETGTWLPTEAERAELAEDRAELAEDRALAEHARALAEHARADIERQSAAAERSRAEAAEADAVRLRAELAALKRAAE